MADDILRKFGIDPDKLEPQFDYSWAFEPYLETDNPGILAIANQLAAPALQLWSGSRQRIHKEVQSNVASCMQVILLNLIRAAKHDQRLSVGIGTGHGALNSAKRYRPEFMAERAFTDARDKLLDSGTIAETASAFNHSGGSQVARYRLTEIALLELTDHSREKKAELAHDFRVSSAIETIRLKDKGKAKQDSRLCSYKDTTETRRMRASLVRINAVLAGATITADVPLVLPKGRGITLHPRQTLYRVFNNKSFKYGGRFFGGSWQGVPSQIRQFLRINGHKTIEADFRGLFLAMLFAEAGHIISDDPYSAIPNLAAGKGQEEEKDWRDNVKKTIQALLNAPGETVVPADSFTARYGMDRLEFHHFIRTSLPMLKDAFGTGVGLRLMRAESDLMEAILLHFSDQGIPALPIHDSVIIQEDRKDELLAVMRAVFKQKYGQTPPISVK